MTDLAAYGPLSAQIAALPREGQMDILAQAFGEDLSDVTEFDGLVIPSPGLVSRGSADRPRQPFEIQDRVWNLDWYAEAEGFRRIALWMFHLLFSGRDYAGLSFTRQQGQFRTLWVAVERPQPRVARLKFDAPLRYTSYDYMPTAPGRHPFIDLGAGRLSQETDRPMFRLGWSDQAACLSADVAMADEVILSVTPEGLAAMAELLLDFAIPWSEQVEINIEAPDIGFGGTRPLSLEARFWLPGSFAFHAESLDAMVF